MANVGWDCGNNNDFPIYFSNVLENKEIGTIIDNVLRQKNKRVRYNTKGQLQLIGCKDIIYFKCILAEVVDYTNKAIEVFGTIDSLDEINSNLCSYMVNLVNNSICPVCATDNTEISSTIALDEESEKYFGVRTQVKFKCTKCNSTCNSLD